MEFFFYIFKYVYVSKDYFIVLCACTGDSNEKSAFCVEDKFICDELRLKFTSLLLLQLPQKLISDWLSGVVRLATSFVWSSTTIMGVDALEHALSSDVADSSSVGSPIVKRLALGFIISNNHFKNANNINVVCVHRNPPKQANYAFTIFKRTTYIHMFVCTQKISLTTRNAQLNTIINYKAYFFSRRDFKYALINHTMRRSKSNWHRSSGYRWLRQNAFYH